MKKKIHTVDNKLAVRNTETEKYSGRMPEILLLKGKNEEEHYAVLFY